MNFETDAKVLRVLGRALESRSRATRLRAVAMLARVECAARPRWLDVAVGDHDPAVRETALIVSAWVCEEGDPPWPAREDVAEGEDDGAARAGEWLGEAAGMRHEWEYVVEVWRGDGSLVGVFLAATCADDDEHAKCIALGQAILASTSPQGECFDPGEAASFIVGKRRVARESRAQRKGHGRGSE